MIEDPLQVAATMLADRGDPQRLLAEHRRRADGRCAACGNPAPPWPCVHVAIAERATHILHERAARQLE